MTVHPVRAVLTSFLCFAVLGGMEAQEKPYVEKVEINVRTVLVRITDRNGRPPSPPPGPEDVQVLEDGVPMQVLGVDPARPPAVSSAPAAPQPLAKNPEAATALGTPHTTGIPQHLYVDTALLEPSSIKRLVGALDGSLDRILANGPLEIVVADPLPRQFLVASRDPQTVRQSLDELNRSVVGKQTLIVQRRVALDHMRNDPCPNYEMTSRLAAEQELRIIQDSFDRLVRWAASFGGQRPDVVYYVADGFDSNVVATYVEVIRILDNPVAGASLCAPNKPPDQLTVELTLEFAPQGGEIVGLAAKSLSALGVEAVPLILGGNLKDLGNDASATGGDGFRSRSGIIPLFAEPTSAMRVLAETTGGEVVTSVGHLPAVLDAYEGSYIVSFRSERPSDGKIHSLKVTTGREGLGVRSAQYTTQGSADSVAQGMTVRALQEPPSQGGMPIRLSVDGIAAKGKEKTGVLHVDADLATLVSTLEVLQGGHMRVTIAVEVEGAREPFTTRQEFDVPAKQAGWGADIPITWPARGRKVAVTVEELNTGTHATGTVELPK